MGCSGSKAAVGVCHGAESSGYQNKETLPGPEEILSDHDKENKSKTGKGNLKKKPKKGSNIKRTTGSTHAPYDSTALNQLPDIPAFSGYSPENTELGVNNAKPRLDFPGISRGGRLAPITPGVERHEERILDLHYHRNSFGPGQPIQVNGCGIRGVDTPSVDSCVRLSLTSSDLGFYQSRPTHSSLSPRNSISRNTMKTGLTPDSSGVFSFSEGGSFMNGGYENSPLNTSRSFALPVSRVGSARTSSVLTTNALNTSFVTSVDGEDAPSCEVTMELYQLDLTDDRNDSEPNSGAASTTPHMRFSADPYPTVPPDVCGIATIVEEYEGGFTPRGASKETTAAELTPRPGKTLPNFTPKEIFEHNDRVGHTDWSIYKGKVYDVQRLEKTFGPIINNLEHERQQENNRKRRKHTEQQNTKTSDYVNGLECDSDSCDSQTDKTNPGLSCGSVRNVLSAGVVPTGVAHLLPTCCVGVLARPGEARYWQDVRSDVKRVLDDLTLTDAAPCSLEYKDLLQRWISKYRNVDPKPPLMSPGLDTGQQPFPLPTEIAENPMCLREWIISWEAFDLDLPETGIAWDLAESVEEDKDLDPDETFKSSLRPYLHYLPELNFAITGEAAWNVISLNLFADDVMTEGQVQVEESRRLRTDLYDLSRMERRRSHLFDYFITKYDYDRAKITRFSQWVEEMQRGEKELLRLCT